MQLNRNLELIHTRTGSVMWETQTLDSDIYEAVMQQNGNFVLTNQNRSKSFWASQTANSIYQIGSSLHLGNDGNLVMRDPNKNGIWDTSTKTVCSGLVLAICWLRDALCKKCHIDQKFQKCYHVYQRL